MKITVFGGSKPNPGEAAYEEAYQLGCMIGNAGHTVLTGGYIGTMEAVSRGVSEAGGHVIGVTCEQIEAWRPVQPNAWVQEEIRLPTLHQRLISLIDLCDVAMALSGGPGTLTEVSLTWNLLLTASIPPKPLILIGPDWKQFLDCYLSTFGSYVPENQRRWLSLATDIKSAVAQLTDYFADPGQQSYQAGRS